MHVHVSAIVDVDMGVDVLVVKDSGRTDRPPHVHQPSPVTVHKIRRRRIQ